MVSSERCSPPNFIGAHAAATDHEVPRMPPTFKAIKLLIAPSEGNIAHMYVDTTGHVTVGIGNMLPSAVAACALPFIDRTTKNRATAAQITADFVAVAAQPKAKVARFYRPFTKLDLPDVEISRLFRARVDSFVQELRDSYPHYDDYPDPVQLAMLDMAFNLGTRGLTNKWPKLNKAIATEDWATAATECYRLDANAPRNAAVKALFEAGVAEARRVRIRVARRAANDGRRRRP